MFSIFACSLCISVSISKRADESFLIVLCIVDSLVNSMNVGSTNETSHYN
jgi:hypothetical protein